MGIAPWAVLNGWLLSDPDFPPIGWMVLLFLEVPWATAPLTVVLGDLMFGMPVKRARIARTLLESLPALSSSQLVLRGILLLFFVLYRVVAAEFVISPVLDLCFLSVMPSLCFPQRGYLARAEEHSRKFKRSRDRSAAGSRVKLFTRLARPAFPGTIFASAC